MRIFTLKDKELRKTQLEIIFSSTYRVNPLVLINLYKISAYNTSFRVAEKFLYFLLRPCNHISMALNRLNVTESRILLRRPDIYDQTTRFGFPWASGTSIFVQFTNVYKILSGNPGTDFSFKL